MRNISEYRTSAEAAEGAKADTLAAIDRLRASVERQGYVPANGWGVAGSLARVCGQVEELDGFMNGTNP